MKRRRIFEEDKQAVSPVIATILMVAITVVLAATLYMMIDTDTGGDTPVAGSLTVQDRDTANDNLTLELAMSTPSSVPTDDIDVTVFNADGEEVFDGSPGTSYAADGAWWQYRPGDDGEVRGGARLRINDETDSFRNYEIIMSIEGYSGTISTTVS
ncbi:MAG: type IV pilin N-terminal domain-containing protein [Thermoplasmata archaeon]